MACILLNAKKGSLERNGGHLKNGNKQLCMEYKVKSLTHSHLNFFIVGIYSHTPLHSQSFLISFVCSLQLCGMYVATIANSMCATMTCLSDCDSLDGEWVGGVG